MVKPYIFILYIECKHPYISLPSVIRFHKMKYIEDCYLCIDKSDFTDFERCTENHNKNSW